MSAERVIERARVGDDSAFGELVDQYGEMVFSLAYSSTLNQADAEDLAQEIFIAAWRGLPRFRGEARLSTWLYAVARNCARDRCRRAAVRPSLVASSSAEADARLPAEDRGATIAAIFAAAAELSLPLRQALLLRDVQGLRYDEIAALQDVPLGTVRSRIATARRAIIDQLGEQ